MKATNKRETILHVAKELIAVNGFHGTTMAMIADKAGIATGTIYRYFTGKDELINELHRELNDRLLRSLMQDYPLGEPMHERFLYVGRYFVHYCLAAPFDFSFLEQFHNSPYGVAYRRELVSNEKTRGPIDELLDEAAREGIIKTLPRTVLTALIFGPLIGVIRDHILGFNRLDEETISRTAEACWDAIRI